MHLRLMSQKRNCLAVFYLADNQMAYFDENGQVVEISDRVVENVMQVSGVTLEKANVGSKVGLKRPVVIYAEPVKNIEKI